MIRILAALKDASNIAPTASYTNTLRGCYIGFENIQELPLLAQCWLSSSERQHIFKKSNKQNLGLETRKALAPAFLRCDERSHQAELLNQH